MPAQLFLSIIFAAALITANVVSTKILVLGPFIVPAGVLAYSITFAMTDTLCELWGRRQAQVVVAAGFLAQLLVLGLILLAVHLPGAPFWKNQAAYASVFGSVNRIILASLVAYLVSQSFDLWAFTWLKERFQGRHLWLRNNLSTAASQSIDTLIFITVAFAGTVAFPNAQALLPLIGGQLAVKWIIAVADTPLVYALVHFLRGQGQSPPRPAARQPV